MALTGAVGPIVAHIPAITNIFKYTVLEYQHVNLISVVCMNVCMYIINSEVL